jgi:hypothetical protein
MLVSSKKVSRKSNGQVFCHREGSKVFVVKVFAKIYRVCWGREDMTKEGHTYDIVRLEHSLRLQAKRSQVLREGYYLVVAVATFSAIGFAMVFVDNAARWIGKSEVLRSTHFGFVHPQCSTSEELSRENRHCKNTPPAMGALAEGISSSAVFPTCSALGVVASLTCLFVVKLLVRWRLWQVGSEEEFHASLDHSLSPINLRFDPTTQSVYAAAADVFHPPAVHHSVSADGLRAE